jgi:hypothetical protein
LGSADPIRTFRLALGCGDVARAAVEALPHPHQCARQAVARWLRVGDGMGDGFVQRPGELLCVALRKRRYLCDNDLIFLLEVGL